VLTDILADLLGTHQVERVGRVQGLWQGYGEVARYRAGNRSVIVKHIRPPADAHPRKLASYEHEEAWYRHWSPHCRARVPTFLGAYADAMQRVLVLEDLATAGFDRPAVEVAPCVDWLARLHACFLGAEPLGLWPVGTYWHLATRSEELERMGNAALRREAPTLDRALRLARHQTIVHGDAKPANFLACATGEVAAVDFQYTGRGPGVRDLAYLLHPRIDSRLVDRYFVRLRQELSPTVDGAALEAEWRNLLPMAHRDFLRFLDGWTRP